MQTFLPYPSFRRSLECLDNKRLGKQRVEAMQLVNALERGNGAWYNHPAAQMWVNNISALKLYHDTAIAVWKSRGFKNTMERYYPFVAEEVVNSIKGGSLTYPEWFGNEDFHASHRSNLLRKDPAHYGQFGWTEPHDLPYIWPSKVKEVEDV